MGAYMPDIALRVGTTARGWPNDESPLHTVHVLMTHSDPSAPLTEISRQDPRRRPVPVLDACITRVTPVPCSLCALRMSLPSRACRDAFQRLCLGRAACL